MVQAFELETYCSARLDAAGFDDYCPNGLQVEGTRPIRKIATGVTASLALIEAAGDWKADALLVHHGYFWKGEAPPLTGMKGRRIRALLSHGMSLLAYHLPLDAHAALGNNAQLAGILGFSAPIPPPDGSLLWHAQLRQPVAASRFARLIEAGLGRPPLHIPGGPDDIKKIGWCTGAAQGLIDQAADSGLDAFISGEISEPTVYVARERGIHYYAAGHHATERYGVQALGEELAGHFGLAHRFFDMDNPV